jgi:hypothetical protein
MQKLNDRSQNPSFGLARTILHVHEAMMAARQNSTVGPPNDYLVFIKGQPPLQMPANSVLLERWLTAFSGKGTQSLDSEPSNLAIQAEMRAAGVASFETAKQEEKDEV